MSSNPSTSVLRDLFVTVTGTDEIVEEQVVEHKRVSDGTVDMTAASEDGLRDAVDNGNDDLAGAFD